MSSMNIQNPIYRAGHITIKFYGFFLHILEFSGSKRSKSRSGTKLWWSKPVSSPICGPYHTKLYMIIQNPIYRAGHTTIKFCFFVFYTFWSSLGRKEAKQKWNRVVMVHTTQNYHFHLPIRNRQLNNCAWAGFRITDKDS